MGTNKARITYRFDESEKRGRNRTPEVVIPLTSDQYTLLPDESSIRHDDKYGRRTPVPHSAYSFTERVEAPPHDPAPRTVDLQPLNQFTTDFGAWSSPFDAETERVERMIRGSGGDSRLSGRAIPPAPYLPEEPESDDLESGYGDERRQGRRSFRSDEHPPVHVTGSRFERHNRTPWLKLVASVAGAVATGVMIGFFVLSMFGGEPADGLQDEQAMTNGGVPASASKQSGTPEAAGAPAPAGSATGAVVAVRIEPQQYTLLQNGAFASRQGADGAAAELKKKGLAAYVQATEDKFYVYAGMAISRDDALALSQTLQEQKMELFLKGVSTPGASKIRWAGKQTEQIDLYMSQGHKLVQTIGSFAASGLKQKSPPALEDGAMQAIRTAHQSWSGAAGPFGEGLAPEQSAVLQRMNSAMNTAVAAMEEYKKNASSTYLWQAQAALMQYAFGESELVGAVKAE